MSDPGKTPSKASAPAVFAALDAVRQEANSKGIAKTREVTDGVRFRFRGIDEVMDFFSGPMAAAKIMAIPSFRNLKRHDRQTAGGKANYNYRVEGTITFTSLEDGSQLVAGPFYGEANDTADKAITKAQSVAFRHGMLMTFIVPLGPEMDPETATDEGAQDAAPPKPKKGDRAEKPAPGAKKPAKKKAAKVAPGIDLPENMKRVLMSKARVAGLETEEALLAVHPGINQDNINDVLQDLGKRAMS